MADNRKLNEEELKNISGGKLTDEAQGWYDRNIDGLRAQSAFGLMGLGYLFESETSYTLEDLKAALTTKGYNLTGMT